MNKNEILDVVLEILDGTSDKSFGKIRKDIKKNLIIEDEEVSGRYKFVPEFYKRLAKFEDKKKILFSALISENKESQNLGTYIMETDPKVFFSEEELKKLLNSGKLQELHITGYSIILNIIHSPAEIDKYLTLPAEEFEKLNLSRNQVANLIEASGNIDKYLTLPAEEFEKFNLSRNQVANLIEASGNIEKYLTSPAEEFKKFKLYRNQVVNIIKASENIDKYLNPENIAKFNLSESYVSDLIKASGNIDKYLTLPTEKFRKFNLSGHDVLDLIKTSGNIDKYINPENIAKFNLSGSYVSDLIKASGNIDKYLALPAEKLKKFKLFGEFDFLGGGKVRDLIIASGNIDKYLTPENIAKFNLSRYDVLGLINASENIDKYLNPENIAKFNLSESYVSDLIKASGNIDKYLTLPTEEFKKFNLSEFYVSDLIKASGNIDKYLNPENIAKFNLSGKEVSDLIIASGNIDKYLTLPAEELKKFKLFNDQVVYLIKNSGNEEIYIKNIEQIQKYGLNASIVSDILLYDTPYYNISEDPLLIAIFGERPDPVAKVVANLFANTIDTEIKNGTYTYERARNVLPIIDKLKETNSGRLNRIIEPIIEQILQLPSNKQQEEAENIKRIFETTDVPEFAQNFLVFKELHPNFMGEENAGMHSEKIGDIPSLSQVTPMQRKNIIFSDLLKCSVESNNRNLKEYLNTIEQGDILFEMFKAGKLSIDDTLADDERRTLKKYSNMLNTLYNQTSRGKHLTEPRKNSGDLGQDLIELNALFEGDENIHMPLKDRIVRTFGYWAGIRNFEQAKKIMEEIPEQADKQNRERAINHDFYIKKGDFVKGIRATRFFPSMLQNGIVAKDYLGQSAKNDRTPLDTDVELVKRDEKMFTAPYYTYKDVRGKLLGKILLVMKNDDKYVRTREGKTINEEAVQTVIDDRQKIEYFDNNGTGGDNAYGIRTGIGSTNISFIIADRYVDKLGLEIAMNGFYIPIIDKYKNLLYTPEMYDEIRSKMQGLSHYGLIEFQLDPSAKNIGTEQITRVIEQSKEDAQNKREKILSTLEEAIKSYGLNMSDKRMDELLSGTVEIIDTGSTGRATNLPGDGDFDFMVRLDASIFNSPENLKQCLKDELTRCGKPKGDVRTRNGDFRLKGVSIEGLKEKVDLDLSFTKRTDEIEYSTEECIKDRLETIRRKSPEDYEYVVANILMAKTFLKESGVYKKSSSPAPKRGEKDTRGGLGPVGIENWILQNGGSFEKAARDFLEVSTQCTGLEDFQKKYAIWDFGENYMAGKSYSHDNFVYNMNENGYSNMVNAIKNYIKNVETERKTKVNQEEKGIGDIVREDMSVLDDTLFMQTVERILQSAKEMNNESQKQEIK